MGNDVSLNYQIIEDYGAIKLTKVGAALQLFAIKHTFDCLISSRQFQLLFETIFNKKCQYQFQQYNSAVGVSGLEVFCCLYLLCEADQIPIDQKLDALIALCQFNPIPELVVNNFSYNKPDDYVLVDQLKLMFQCVVYGICRLAGKRRLPQADAINSVAEQYFSTTEGFNSKLEWVYIKQQILASRPVFQFLEQFMPALHVPSLLVDLSSVVHSVETKASFLLGVPGTFSSKLNSDHSATVDSIEVLDVAGNNKSLEKAPDVSIENEDDMSSSQVSTKHSQFGSLDGFSDVQWPSSSDKRKKTIVKRNSTLLGSQKRATIIKPNSSNRVSMKRRRTTDVKSKRLGNRKESVSGEVERMVGNDGEQNNEVSEENTADNKVSTLAADKGDGSGIDHTTHQLQSLAWGTKTGDLSEKLSETPTSELPIQPARPASSASSSHHPIHRSTRQSIFSNPTQLDFRLVGSINKTTKQKIADLIASAASSCSSFSFDYKEFAVIDATIETISSDPTGFYRPLFHYLVQSICAFNIVSAATTNDNHITSEQFIPLIRLCHQPKEITTSFHYADDAPLASQAGPQAEQTTDCTNELRLQYEISVMQIELSNYRQKQQDLADTLKSYGYGSSNQGAMQPSRPTTTMSMSSARAAAVSAAAVANAAAASARPTQSGRGRQQQQQGAHSNPAVRAFAATILARTNATNLSRRGWLEIRLSECIRKLYDLPDKPDDTQRVRLAENVMNKVQLFWNELLKNEVLIYENKLLMYVKSCIGYKLRVPTSVASKGSIVSVAQKTVLTEYSNFFDIFVENKCTVENRDLIQSTISFAVGDFIRACNAQGVKAQENAKQSITNTLKIESSKEAFVLSETVNQSASLIEQYVADLIRYIRGLL